MNKKAICDVLNSLKVIEEGGGDSPYRLVEHSAENVLKLGAVGVYPETIQKYGDADTFCILALAFNEKYADDFVDGKFVYWDCLVDEDVRQRVLRGEGTASDAERLLRALEPGLFGEHEKFSSFAHQPSYEDFKKQTKHDDLVFQAIVHLQHASQEFAWANTVLELVPHVPDELKECIKSAFSEIHPFVEELRKYRVPYEGRKQ